jgi:hypothetical protein
MSPLTGSSVVFIRHYSNFCGYCIISVKLLGTLIWLFLTGIGKTYFGYVLLLHYARLGSTVVYIESGKAK